MFWSPLTRRVAFWLTWCTVVIGIGHLFLHVDQKAIEDRFGLHYTRWLDMNAEQSVATWFNVGLLQLAAALAVLGAIAVATRRQRIAWSALATAIFLLSLDEKISIHEALPSLLGMDQGDLVTHEWLIPGVAVALTALLVLVPLLRPLPRPLVVGLLLAMVVYGSGAVGVELVSGAAVRTLDIEHPLRQLMPVWEWVEESLEMLGCILAITALLRHLERMRVVDVARWRQLGRQARRPVRPAPRAAGSLSRHR
ncbi:hypothetical protein [Ornithinimicrobium sufpigmenti]|uniref:hypothetical protein n=1 Tax=Ornithinimicrobium sufpigmenti TaxID=2508882 RepID=UPI0010360B05|nr:MULTISPECIES: hypothetical protein [unclassified Ornithinimicrobium]